MNFHLISILGPSADSGPVTWETNLTRPIYIYAIIYARQNVHTFLSPIFPDKADKSKLKPVSRKLTLDANIDWSPKRTLRSNNCTELYTRPPLLMKTHETVLAQRKNAIYHCSAQYPFAVS